MIILIFYSERSSFIKRLGQFCCSTSLCKMVQSWFTVVSTKKNATWNKLIKSLKSRSVNLPNVASEIKNMLDNRVSYIAS